MTYVGCWSDVWVSRGRCSEAQQVHDAKASWPNGVVDDGSTSNVLRSDPGQKQDLVRSCLGHATDPIWMSWGQTRARLGFNPGLDQIWNKPRDGQNMSLGQTRSFFRVGPGPESGRTQTDKRTNVSRQTRNRNRAFLWFRFDLSKPTYRSDPGHGLCLGQTRAVGRV